MNRPAGRLLVAALFLTSGCASFASAPTKSAGPSSLAEATSRTWSNETQSPVENKSLALSRGEERTVQLQVRQVGELHIQRLSSGQIGDENSAVTLEVESLQPKPDYVVTTYPPYYTWDSVQQNVTVTITVRVARNATPGTYQFEAVAWQDTNHSHSDGATGTITITVDS